MSLRHDELCTHENQRLAPPQVLVEVQREPAASLGGILMPSAFSEDDEALYEDAFGKKENLVGTVIAVGPGHPAEDGELVPIDNLEVGMKVVIAAVDGIKVEPQGKSDRDSMFFLYVCPYSRTDGLILYIRTESSTSRNPLVSSCSRGLVCP